VRWLWELETEDLTDMEVDEGVEEEGVEEVEVVEDGEENGHIEYKITS